MPFVGMPKPWTLFTIFTTLLPAVVRWGPCETMVALLVASWRRKRESGDAEPSARTAQASTIRPSTI